MKAILLTVLLLTTACATTSPHAQSEIASLSSPWEVQAYLKKSVGDKELKRWDSHVSDNTMVVQVEAQPAQNRQKKLEIYDYNGHRIGTINAK